MMGEAKDVMPMAQGDSLGQNEKIDMPNMSEKSGSLPKSPRDSLPGDEDGKKEKKDKPSQGAYLVR